MSCSVTKPYVTVPCAPLLQPPASMNASSSGGGSSSAASNGLRPLDLGGHVGFDSLPDQLVNKAVQGGFTFNVMCIGETGLGKSTLVDSLFNTNFESAQASHKEAEVKLKAHTYELEESSVKLKVGGSEKTYGWMDDNF